ncbi:MAG TPA: hypothetical protein VG268_21745 [Streptosporangiaceae bacterium]|nr:hypothetical protein [Streptosporangiaceae bacterium]
MLLLSPKSPGNRLRASATASAASLAGYLHAVIRGDPGGPEHDALMAAKRTLMDTFAATPYRPTGLATADQAMANVVQALEWSATLAGDATHEHGELSRAAPADLDLLGVAAGHERVAAQVGRTPRAHWPHVSGATLASFAPLEPVRFADPGQEYPANVESAENEGLTAARGATVVAEQDVALAESMVAADTVTVADAVPAAPAGRITAGVTRVQGHLLWVHEHLQHLSARARTISGSATHLAELRQRPWWR